MSTVCTVTCSENCGWSTDFEILSDTNPHRCPHCGAEIVVEGTGQLYDEYLENREWDEA